jgi:hypothetical protein
MGPKVEDAEAFQDANAFLDTQASTLLDPRSSIELLCNALARTNGNNTNSCESLLQSGMAVPSGNRAPATAQAVEVQTEPSATVDLLLKLDPSLKLRMSLPERIDTTDHMTDFVNAPVNGPVPKSPSESASNVRHQFSSATVDMISSLTFMNGKRPCAASLTSKKDVENQQAYSEDTLHPNCQLDVPSRQKASSSIFKPLKSDGPDSIQNRPPTISQHDQQMQTEWSAPSLPFSSQSMDQTAPDHAIISGDNDSVTEHPLPLPPSSGVDDNMRKSYALATTDAHYSHTSSKSMTNDKYIRSQISHSENNTSTTVKEGVRHLDDTIGVDASCTSPEIAEIRDARPCGESTMDSIAAWRRYSVGVALEQEGHFQQAAMAFQEAREALPFEPDFSLRLWNCQQVGYLGGNDLWDEIVCANALATTNGSIRWPWFVSGENGSCKLFVPTLPELWRV